MQLIRQGVLFICILLISASYCFGSSPLVSIAISPTNPTIPLGLNQQFTAIGTYKNHETMDITASVTWSSSDPAVAIISNSVGSNGLATSVAVGSVVITAVDPSTGISSSGNLTVSPPALQSISTNPANPTVTSGHSINLSATGIYTDGSIQNVTGIANWSVANPLVATVDRTGVVTCLGGGESTVTAASGAISGSTNLTVTTTPTALTSIKIR